MNAWPRNASGPKKYVVEKITKVPMYHLKGADGMNMFTTFVELDIRKEDLT